jgi:hypothetical protein
VDLKKGGSWVYLPPAAAAGAAPAGVEVFLSSPFGEAAAAAFPPLAGFGEAALSAPFFGEAALFGETAFSAPAAFLSLDLDLLSDIVEDRAICAKLSFLMQLVQPSRSANFFEIIWEVSNGILYTVKRFTFLSIVQIIGTTSVFFLFGGVS